MSTLRIEHDEAGYPILLGEHPATSKSPEVTAAAKSTQSEHQQEWDAGPWDRRMDAVRDAAREFEAFGVQDARDFILGRTNRILTDAEVMQFLGDVREQQLTDLADALDHGSRGITRRRRLVRVVAPRNYVRKTLNGLTDPELARLEQRLKARGWTDTQVEQGVRAKMSPARLAARQHQPPPQTTSQS